MAASYPTSIKTNFAAKAHGHVIYASHLTDIEDEVVAIETELLKTGTTLMADLSICEGRLTLTSGTAVTTADVTGATNVYFAPYAGNRIALYDGSSAWNIRTFTQITIALGTITAAKPYDLFCYDNSGTVTFDSPLAWTNSTTRATALVLQDGVLVKTGATTRRYIGTFYTTATTTTEDSKAKRFLWNYYNRVDRGMQALIATNSWTYTTGTVRQAEGSIANQLDFVVGFSEDCVTAISAVAASNNTEGQKWRMGIGFDSTSAYHADSLRGDRSQRLPVSGRETAHATWSGYPGVGRHYLTMLENGNDSGTTTWLGDDGSTYQQAGIQGMIRS